ncbi:uncharacterized protein C2845_PM03G34000 [Panicum miliaceum]|uniref:C2H2-type domain-containing protein n=1 Tax=Panicum miliaceum TaxID=4540 RepID=A0A3L6T7A8_PANMI|nr:uncharacterized protein C2845_PM03G34000 [Panicum miliaceum]
MEFAHLRRPTPAAADDVETDRLRRFPDLPPPPHGDANASPVDAALARRREELLWELHKARIHHSTILRELVETELAMGFAAAGHNPVHPPCGCRGPAAVRVPPVYPIVEWLPSPGHRCLRALVQEASVPPAANAGARPTLHEVPPGHNDAVGGRHKYDVKDGHDVHQLYESGNQSNGQRKTAETTQVDEINGSMLRPNQYRMAAQESAAFDQQKGREFIVNIAEEKLVNDYLMHVCCGTQRPEQRQLGNGVEQQQECRSPGAGAGAGAHLFNGNAELCLSPSKRSLAEETLVPVAAKAEEVASLENAAYNELKKVEFSESAREGTSAGVKRKLNEASPPVKKQKKPLGRHSCAICHVNTPSPRNLEEHLAGKMHRWNVAAALEASRKMSDWYCKLCDVQCNSEKMLASHLGGKKHHERWLEGLEGRAA